jgi:serine/threonine-protein kinase
MAPEVLEGMSHSTASDVYSFGVVWFEMLTGQLPFESAASPSRALECLEAPAPAPSSFDTRLSRELDDIVRRCLARAPAVRFASAGEGLDALETLDGRRPGSVQPVTRSRQSLPPAGKTRLTPLLALVGIAVVGGAYWVGWSQRISQQAPPTASVSSAASEASPKLARVPERVLPPRPNPRADDVATAVTTTTTALPESPPAGAAIRPAHPGPRKVARPISNPAPSGQAILPAHSAVSAPLTPAAAPATPPNPALPTPPLRSTKPDWEDPFGSTQRRTARGRSP